MHSMHRTLAESPRGIGPIAFRLPAVAGLSRLAAPFRAVRDWHAGAKTRAAAMRLDDRTLNDIGLSRSDLMSIVATGSLDRPVRNEEPDWRTRPPSAWTAEIERGIGNARRLRAEAMQRALRSAMLFPVRLCRAFGR